TRCLRALCALLGEQLDGSLRADSLDRVTLTQTRVRLPVRDVGAEPPRPENDRSAGRRIGPELAERAGRTASAASSRGLREEGAGLVERDREELILGLEGARLGALLHVRPIATVLRRHVLTVELADESRKGEELRRLLERD